MAAHAMDHVVALGIGVKACLPERECEEKEKPHQLSSTPMTTAVEQ